VEPATVASHYRTVLEELNDAVLQRHLRKDFASVFEKYIHA